MAPKTATPATAAPTKAAPAKAATTAPAKTAAAPAKTAAATPVVKAPKVAGIKRTPIIGAARPLLSIRRADGPDSVAEQVPIPHVFLAPIRPDIVHFVHSNMAKNHRQAYAVSVGAGHQHSAESWGTGRAVSRIPRVSGGGTSRAGQAAFGNMCRAGRMFAPTKIWRKWHRKINTNQKRFAVASALAASALPSLVMARGHKVDSVPEIPLVVTTDLESITRTKQAISALKAVGAYTDVIKAKDSKKLRAGKGKMRNRRHVNRRGPLVVFANDHGIVRAFRNLPGVEVTNVASLNLLQLAPGGHLGRFILWTKSAIAKLGENWGSFTRVSKTKSGYTLPRPIMTNSDLARVINSDEIQTRIRGSIKHVTRFVRHKNPVKNFGQLVRLNPYALALRRSELLTTERHAKARATTLENRRKGIKAKPSVDDVAAAKRAKAHRPSQVHNYAALLDFDAVKKASEDAKSAKRAATKAAKPAKAAPKTAAKSAAPVAKGKAASAKSPTTAPAKSPATKDAKK